MDPVGDDPAADADPPEIRWRFDLFAKVQARVQARTNVLKVQSYVH